MRFTLIRPPVVHRRGDLLGSIPGIPVALAHLAAVVRSKGIDTGIVDCYGLAPHHLYPVGARHIARGIRASRLAGEIDSGTDVVGISVHCTTEQAVAPFLIQEIRAAHPDMPIVVGGFHPTFLPKAFLSMGADYVVLGAGEARLPALLNAIGGNGSVSDIDGIASNDGISPVTTHVEELDGFPIPAVELLPLENYWKLRYGHGPVRGRYMNVLTSRGCPFRCGFCQAPLMSGGRWIARSPSDIIRELEHYYTTWGITDFHIQDENFALNRQRAERFCHDIISLQRGFSFSLPCGINAMTLDEELVSLMAKAGFRYLSVSPESGSPRVLELMDKTMDLTHLRAVVRWATKAGIRTNACFMLGYPGEKDADRRATKRYIARLAKDGVNEIIIPIMTPFPGTPSMDWFPGCETEELCFTPRWRKDYQQLSWVRRGIYARFLLGRLIHHPVSLIRQFTNIVTRNHETKGEMTVTRLLRDVVDWYGRRTLRTLTTRMRRLGRTRGSVSP